MEFSLYRMHFFKCTKTGRARAIPTATVANVLSTKLMLTAESKIFHFKFVVLQVAGVGKRKAPGRCRCPLLIGWIACF